MICGHAWKLVVVAWTQHEAGHFHPDYQIVFGVGSKVGFDDEVRAENLRGEEDNLGSALRLRV
jgi:hypothetical protein